MRGDLYTIKINSPTKLALKDEYWNCNEHKIDINENVNMNENKK